MDANDTTPTTTHGLVIPQSFESNILEHGNQMSSFQKSAGWVVVGAIVGGAVVWTATKKCSVQRDSIKEIKQISVCSILI